MIITLDKNIGSRLTHWSKANRRSPNAFVHDILQQSLDDWEDYSEAINICSEVDAGRMKVYSLDEVEKQLNELNAEVYKKKGRSG